MSVDAPVPAAGAAGAPLLVQEEGLQGERRAARLGVGVVRDLGGLVPGGTHGPRGGSRKVNEEIRNGFQR